MVNMASIFPLVGTSLRANTSCLFADYRIRSRSACHECGTAVPGVSASIGWCPLKPSRVGLEERVREVGFRQDLHRSSSRWEDLCKKLAIAL